MNNKRQTEFRSEIDYVPSHGQLERLGCISLIIPFDIAIIPIMLVYLVGELVVGIAYRILKRDYSLDRKVYSAVRVFDNSLLLEIFPDKRERVTLNWLKKIVVKEIKLPNLPAEKNPIKVFEFHHKLGQKPLLSYDLHGREIFEDILREKGVAIEGV